MSFYPQAELERLGLRAVGRNVSLSTKASLHGSERISLGDHVRIDDFCVLSAGEGGIVLGDHIHIGVYSCLLGSAAIELEDFVNISSRVSIYSSNDDYSGAAMTNPTVPAVYTNVRSAPVRIGRHAIIGSGCVVLPGVNIGEAVAVGALSLIKSDCPAFGIYCGVPARRSGERKRDLLQLEQMFRAGERPAA